MDNRNTGRLYIAQECVTLFYNEVDVIATGVARTIGQYSSQYFVLTAYLGSRKINR